MLKSVVSNGVAFVKLTLQEDFHVTDITERSNLIRIIIQAFSEFVPEGSSSTNDVEIDYAEMELPAYEEVLPQSAP